MDEIIIENVEETQQESTVNKGNVKISNEVVATIAGIAANEINGVSGMCGNIAGGIAELLGSKKNSSKGVKVEITEESAVIDLYIVVEYGIRIPDLAWELQENVKASVESMTGLKVDKVNIHVDGVSFEKDKKAKKDENSIIIEELDLEDYPEEGSEGL